MVKIIDNNSIKIRVMHGDDIPAAMRLSIAEGWNQTEEDWSMLLRHTPGYAFAAVNKDQIIGTVVTLLFDDQLAWIGMMLVDNSYRGQGIAKTLLNHALSTIQNIPVVKLDATPAGRPFYKKIGFRDECEIYRMVSDSSRVISEKHDLNVLPGKNENINSVIEKDYAAIGYKRPDILKGLQREYPGYSFVLHAHGQLKSFIFGRDGRSYTQLGPLNADSLESAKKIVRYLLYNLKGKAVVIDIPAEKIDFYNWLISLRFKKQRAFTRMYYKNNLPLTSTENQYAITGPEWG
jgi:GNAT superfamily N-acetyltransferase